MYFLEIKQAKYTALLSNFDHTFVKITKYKNSVKITKEKLFIKRVVTDRAKYQF